VKFSRRPLKEVKQDIDSMSGFAPLRSTPDRL
jgi:hypothetical protein